MLEKPGTLTTGKNSITEANDAVNNRSNSIGVAKGIVFLFFSLYAILCKSQPRDWEGCASKLVPEEWDLKI